MENIEERQPFQTGDVIEDMMGYAQKLNALGDVVMTMSWLHEAHNVGEAEFLRFGQDLGEIIQDYADALHIMLYKESLNFVDREKEVVFPLGQCREVYNFIGKTRRKEDLCAVDYRLKELDEFIEKAAVPAINLKNDFEQLRKEILNSTNSKAQTAKVALGT